MAESARTRRHIRTPESRERERVAKEVAAEFLRSRGVRVERTRTVRTRYLIDVTGTDGRQRTLWFKLGWNPEDHGTSGVQIEMIKVRGSGKRPAQLSDAEVQREVSAKFKRAAAIGVTDMLLFSLDNENRRPIACLILPLDDAAATFAECLRIDARRTRKGASPTFWVLGNDPTTRALQACVERHASHDLTNSAPVLLSPQSPSMDSLRDAYEDWIPDGTLLGTISPERVQIKSSRFQRDDRVRTNALRRAKGVCEFCNQVGFLTGSGEPYLETHHIQALGEDGPDTEENVIAICANDHRAAHFSAERQILAQKMREILAEKLRSCKRNRST